MSTRLSSVPEEVSWKKAYRAAVLEKDHTRLPRLIQEARETLSQRLHKLWSLGPIPNDELEAIHDALYLLEALLSSLPYRGETAQWNRPSGPS